LDGDGLGSFGRYFQNGQRFLLSISYKMSDILSDKFLGRRIHPRKTRRWEASARAGVTPRNFWAD
jgi:hypothetical protein